MHSAVLQGCNTALHYHRSAVLKSFVQSPVPEIAANFCCAKGCCGVAALMLLHMQSPCRLASMLPALSWLHAWQPSQKPHACCNRVRTMLSLLTVQVQAPLSADAEWTPRDVSCSDVLHALESMPHGGLNPATLHAFLCCEHDNSLQNLIAQGSLAEGL